MPHPDLEVLTDKKKDKRRTSRSIRLERVAEVVEFSAQGLGAYEIAKRLNVDPQTIYNDLDLYRRIFEFFDQTQQRIPHLMAKSNRVLKAAWVKLAPMLADPSSNPKSVAALISAINAIIGTQARILGVDQAPAGTGNSKLAEAMVIHIHTGETKETVTLSPAASSRDLPQLPEVILDSLPIGNGRRPAVREKDSELS